MPSELPAPSEIVPPPIAAEEPAPSPAVVVSSVIVVEPPAPEMEQSGLLIDPLPAPAIEVASIEVPAIVAEHAPPPASKTTHWSLPDAIPISVAPLPADAEASRIERPTVPSAHRRLRRARWPLRIALLVAIVGAELVLAHRTGAIALPKDVGELRAMFSAMSEHGTAPATIAAPPATTEAPAAPPTTTEPTQESAPSPVTIPPGMGLLDTRGALPGHRIFVNGLTVGQTPDAVLVPCGTAFVKLGSAGRAQSIEIPCGAELIVNDQ